VLQRFAGLAARYLVPELRVEVGIFDPVQLGPGYAVHMSRDLLGI
jgi:hypothetical protein